MLTILPLLVFICVTTATPSSSPGPNLVGDSPQARTLFYVADLNHDDHLSRSEFHAAFLGFDINGDAEVTLTEFLQEWTNQTYGPKTEGIRLFLNLDVNKDSIITEPIDMPYVFHFFDWNDDKVVTEGEFVIQWVKLSL